MRILCVALACLAIDGAGYWASLDALSAAWRPLQGRWLIVSAQRDGENDPTHVGATLTFAGDIVHFEPGHDYVGSANPSSVLTSTIQGNAEIMDGTR